MTNLDDIDVDLELLMDRLDPNYIPNIAEQLTIIKKLYPYLLPMSEEEWDRRRKDGFYTEPKQRWVFGDVTSLTNCVVANNGGDGIRAAIEVTTNSDPIPVFVASGEPPKQQVFIHHAEYGSQECYKDVTDLIRNRQDQFTKLEMLVSNHTMGGDPLRGKKKVLIIEYSTVYGKQRWQRKVFNEGQIARIP